MVRSSIYRKLGGLDDRFFAHMEEIDLCWRMQLEGYKVTVVPQSLVYHVGGGTLPATSPFKLFLNFRNNLLMLDNNLAKTLALEEYRKGHSAYMSAKRGLRRAERRIRTRLWLDRLAAAVYLITLKFECFKSVCKAHKEFKAKTVRIDAEQMTQYLQNVSEETGVIGIYKKWIVLRSMLKGSNIFNSMAEKDFYKM